MKNTKQNLGKNITYYLAFLALITVGVFGTACSTETKKTNDNTSEGETKTTQGKGKPESTPTPESKEEKSDDESKDEEKSDDKSKDDSKDEDDKSEEKKEENAKGEPKANKLDEAVSKLKKGAIYGTSRANLINAGWKPVVKSGSKSGNEKYLAEQLKFTEVDSCSGTGVGYCSLVLKAPDGRTLTITTVNNDSVQKSDPTIDSWSVSK